MLYPEFILSVGVGIPTDPYRSALNPAGVSIPISTLIPLFSKYSVRSIEFPPNLPSFS
tara:strand:- start:1677 stop:1850 length:174 start_codon:yes stop_codon:yes gene_type:complete